jgi:hypothetical protein
MKFESVEFTQGFIQINPSRPLINKRQLGVKRLTEAFLIGFNENDKGERLLANLPYAAEATTHDYSRLDESLCTAGGRTQVLTTPPRLGSAANLAAAVAADTSTGSAVWSARQSRRSGVL